MNRPGFDDCSDVKQIGRRPPHCALRPFWMRSRRSPAVSEGSRPNCMITPLVFVVTHRSPLKRFEPFGCCGHSAVKGHDRFADQHEGGNGRSARLRMFELVALSVPVVVGRPDRRHIDEMLEGFPGSCNQHGEMATAKRPVDLNRY